MDFAGILVKFANEISNAGWTFLFALSTLLGVLYTITALLNHSKENAIPGNHANSGWGKLAIRLAIACFLANLGVFISITYHSFLPDEVTYGPISYMTSKEYGAFKDLTNAVLTIASLFGGYYAFSGLLKLYDITENHHSYRGGGTARVAVVQICCGAFLVQIDEVVKLINKGLQFQ